MQNRARYICLALLFVLAAGYQAGTDYTFVDFLRHGSERVRSPIGVELSTMTVASVSDAAKRAGIKTGDHITTVNGAPYRDANSRVLRAAHPGDIIHYEFDGKTADVMLEAQRPALITGDDIMEIILVIGAP